MRFNCKIYHSDTNYVLMNQEFDNLTDLAKSLGLTYNQVADISSKKKRKKDYRCFKYFPTIEINKIYNNTNNNGKTASGAARETNSKS